MLFSSGGASFGIVGKLPPKDEKGAKALASLPGSLGAKPAEALLGIIEASISWILNRAKNVVGWVLGISGLLCVDGHQVRII